MESNIWQTANIKQKSEHQKLFKFCIGKEKIMQFFKKGPHQLFLPKTVINGFLSNP